MPSKSKAQRNLMAAAAHNPAFAKKVGVPVSVAQEFNKADKGKKFGGGGMALKKLFKGKETPAEEMKEAKAVKSGKITPREFAKGEKMEGHKGEEKGALKTAMAIKSGKMSPSAYVKSEKEDMMAKGGRIASKGEHAVQKQSKRGAQILKKGGMCKGYARGGGIEVRGKTKGKMC